MDIENPMVLNQEQHDSQMKPYPTLHCDYCGEDVESHNVTEYDGQNICIHCEAQFLKDSAVREHFDGFVVEHWKNYLLWWWDQLSDFERMNLLSEAYSRQDCFERAARRHTLTKSRIDYCSAQEDEFLFYLKEELLCENAE